MKMKTDDKDFDPYSILGIPKDATEEDIERAYKELGKKHHPDMTGDKDSSQFQLAVRAKEILLDPRTRTLYNLQLAQTEKYVAIQEKTLKRVSRFGYLCLAASLFFATVVTFGLYSVDRTLKTGLSELRKTFEETFIGLANFMAYTNEQEYQKGPITIQNSISEAEKDILLIKSGLYSRPDFFVLDDVAENEYPKVPSDLMSDIRDLLSKYDDYLRRMDKFTYQELYAPSLTRNEMSSRALELGQELNQQVLSRTEQYKRENREGLLRLLRAKISLEQRLAEIMPSDYTVMLKE